MRGFRLPSTPEAAKRQQVELAGKVVTSDDFGKIDLVCGVDVSYRNGVASCAAVVVDRDLEVVELATTKSVIKSPYIQGLFMLREAYPALKTLEKLTRYDLLLVDGHGNLHPRRCGLACYLGIVLDKPTIGVAKSLFCGTENKGKVELDGEALGLVLTGTKNKKKLYISVGHRVSLQSALELVTSVIMEGEWVPEPLRLADIQSRLSL